MIFVDKFRAKIGKNFVNCRVIKLKSVILFDLYFKLLKNNTLNFIYAKRRRKVNTDQHC